MRRRSVHGSDGAVVRFAEVLSNLQDLRAAGVDRLIAERIEAMLHTQALLAERLDAQARQIHDLQQDIAALREVGP